MRIRIDRIAYELPKQIVTNAQLSRRNRQWSMELVEKRAGVMKRHIASPRETALDLALRASRKLLKSDGKPEIDGIIFCTQSEDHIMPPNACLLHKSLDLDDNVFAFDFNHGCSGFIYGLALAHGLVSSKIAKHILLINSDTYSKFIHPKDRSSRVLFGDGAAVTKISASDTGQGLIDIRCSTDGKGSGDFIIPAGGCRLPRSLKTSIQKKDPSGNVRTLENIHMDGTNILAFVNSKIPKQIQEILAKNNMTIQDIDLFFFHQASQLVLDVLSRELKIPSVKMFTNIREIGNTVSASIPIAVKDAWDQGRLKRGNKILLCGFGVGLSWGTAIMEF